MRLSGLADLPSEQSPPPEVVSEMEGQCGDGDESLAQQEVDVEFLILHQGVQQAEVVEMSRSGAGHRHQLADGLMEAVVGPVPVDLGRDISRLYSH